VSAGSAARVRRWWTGLIAGENGALPEEAISKLRFAEGALPIIGRLLGLGNVRSIADLLPDDDATMSQLLTLAHEWTGRMLEPDATAIDGEARELEAS
jgi:hypothetical protein